MKRNPLIPFALIAALGIIVMFVFSFQGLNKSKELADAKNGGKPAQTASKPEAKAAVSEVRLGSKYLISIPAGMA